MLKTKKDKPKFTRKPCNGCQATGWRELDSICGNCKKLLDTAKEYKRQFEQNNEMQIYLAPWAAHALPHISCTNNYELSNEFQRYFDLLIKLLGVPVDNGATWQTGQFERVIDGSRESGKRVFIRPDVRDCLNKIYHLTMSIAIHAYENGEKSGTNIIMRLADGSLTIDAFNEATLKK